MSNNMTEEEQEDAYGTKCNVCGTSWTKTERAIGGNWWHCLPCGKKAEDLKGTKATSTNQLDMFEDAIEEIDWDDWSIFKLDEDAHSSYTGVDHAAPTPFPEDIPESGVSSTQRGGLTKSQKVEYAQDMLDRGYITTVEEYLKLLE